MKKKYLDARGSAAVPMLLVVVAAVVLFLVYRLVSEREQIVVDTEKGDLVATTTNQIRAMRSNIDAAEQMQRTLNDRGENMNSLMQEL